MATTLKTVATFEIATTFKNLLDLSTPVDAATLTAKIQLSNGTGANAADILFHDQRTLAASATENLDLAGSLAGPFGASMVFAEVRAVMVKAAAANTNNVNVIREGTNGVPLFLALGDGIPVPPGGVFAWACGADAKVAVTASTGDLLTFTNSSGSTSVTYDVFIVGTSA
ncbi:hypothetical protein ACIBSW_13165 [Actinoplanes sp. NPDC049668]|uniref:hypothetical protein n=1 Tax=unclassified Actinoplanes TaxID=2626549 RepID=UPI0033A5456F